MPCLGLPLLPLVPEVAVARIRDRQTPHGMLLLKGDPQLLYRLLHAQHGHRWVRAGAGAIDINGMHAPTLPAAAWAAWLS